MNFSMTGQEKGIFDCDVGTCIVTSCSEINGFISLGEIPVFISLENL
jgi:hypothetical protein